MEIKIMATAPNDGWGFIEKEEKLFLLRPPYTTSDLIEVTIKDLSKAIHSYGFEECAISLNSMHEVVKFLKEAYIETKKTQGIELPSFEKLREGLKYATDDVLLEYLKRAKSELIPEGKFDAAESVTIDLMKLERVMTNLEMQKMAIAILENCKEERERLRDLENQIRDNQEETWKARFLGVVSIYPIDAIKKHQKAIAENGQILPMCYCGA
ncbi:hypothetical protein C5S53_15435 [Methanophagales archaeon]|nr:hypothetical protein C5S53_15435 [Methanophagales archaeon]